MVRTALLLPLAAALACQRLPQAAPGPEEAYRTFAAAVRSGQGKVAWAGLSKGTREAIEARSKRTAQASGGLIKDDPSAITFSTGLKPQALEAVTVRSATPDAATLEVTAGGQVTTVTMVKEEGRWVLELADAWKERSADHG